MKKSIGGGFTRSIKAIALVLITVLSVIIQTTNVTAAAGDYIVEWKKSFGGDSQNYFQSVVAVDDGYVAVGNSNGTQASKGGVDATVVKYDTDGYVMWQDNFGGIYEDYFYDVTAMNDGGFIAVGVSYSDDEDMTGVSKSACDAIIVKYNSVGTKVWAKSFGGTGCDYFYDVTATSDGGFIAVGYSDSYDDDMEERSDYGYAVITKFNGSGDVIWANVFGGNGGEEFYGVTATTDGGAVVVGNSYSDDEDMAGLDKGGGTAIIVRYDSNGGIVWKKSFGGTGYDIFNNVTATSDGGFIAVGYASSGDGDMGTITRNSDDAIIVKYNNSGTVQWKKSFGGNDASDEFFDVTVADDGRIIAVGYGYSTNQEMWNLSNNDGSGAAVIVEYDSTGNILRKKGFGGSSWEEFTGVAMNANGIVTVGSSNSGDRDMKNIFMGEHDAIIVKWGESEPPEPIEVQSSAANHTLKINIYDSSSITTLVETCDSIRADQAKNNTYTPETYEALMKACNEAEQTLECLEQGGDIAECGDPEEGKEELEKAIHNLVPIRSNRLSLPNTDAGTLHITILGRNYAIPLLPFIILSIATIAGIALTIFLIRRHIKNKGIGRIKISNPWSKDSYQLTYAKNLAKKHESDPLTEILDVSNIVRKYRIKFVLWHTVPVLAIIGAFIALILVTAPIMADSEYASIDLITTGDDIVTVININKSTSGTTATYSTKIEQIATSIHGGGTIDPEGGVFAKYSPQLTGSQTLGDFATLLSNMTLTTNQIQHTAPGGANLAGGGINLAQSDTVNPMGPLLIPSTFGLATLDGENTFDHNLNLNLDNIKSIPNGTYHIGLEYTITVEEYIPPQEFTFTVDTSAGSYYWYQTTGQFVIPTCNNTDDELFYDWLVYIDKYEYDDGNHSMNLISTDEEAVGVNYTGYAEDYFNSWMPHCNGIVVLDDLEPGIHTITIASNGSADYGWARAFGFGGFGYTEGIDNMLVYLNTPMPLMGFMNSPTDASYAFSEMFHDSASLENSITIGTSNMNMAKITDFSYMFYGTHAGWYTQSLTTPIDLSDLDTSGGKNFEGMFMETYGSTGSLLVDTIDISGLDVSNGTNFSYMFYRTHAENTNITTPLDISNFNASKGIDFSYMFYQTHAYNYGLTDSINVSNFNASSGKNFAHMFEYTHASNFELVNPIDVSNFDVGSGTDFSYMFAGTHEGNDNLTTPIDVSNLNTGNGTDFSYMFVATHGGNNELIAPINVSGLDTSSGTNFQGMFDSTHNWNQKLENPIDVSNLDTGQGIDFSWMFVGTHAGNTVMSTTLDVSGLDTGQGVDFSYMFNGTHEGNNNLTEPLNVSNLDTGNGAYFSFMFGGTHAYNTNLTEPIDVSNLDVSKGTSFYSMFNQTHRNNTNLQTAIDVSNFDTGSGVYFEHMFDFTHYFNDNLQTAIDVSNFDTSKCQNFDYMFAHTHAGANNVLTVPINISGLDTISGLYFNGMFYNTHSGNTALAAPIDPSSMDVSKGISFNWMFSGTHYNNYGISNAKLGDMRFHDSFKDRYIYWNKQNNATNTFYMTFASGDSSVGAEPQYNDGSVLSSVGTTGITTTGAMPYYGRYGITPLPAIGWQ